MRRMFLPKLFPMAHKFSFGLFSNINDLNRWMVFRGESIGGMRHRRYLIFKKFVEFDTSDKIITSSIYGIDSTR
jgi:hypothetical protein